MRSLAFILLQYLFLSIAFGQKASVTKRDGKYGIFDKNHGVILTPECDSIISEPTSYLHTWNDRFFILKKEGKYAFAYFRDLDSLGNFGYLTPHWEISKFDFDELVVISSVQSLQFVTHLVLRYKKNGKYGLIYIRTHLYCESGGFTFCWIDGLGEFNKTEPVYDEPFGYNDDKILHVKSNGKYHLLEFVDRDKRWINYTYNDVFDSIVLYPEDYSEKYYRSVKKDGKWGLVKINPVTKELEYIIPCVSHSYKEIKSTSSYEVFYTKKAVNDTVYINDTKNKLEYKFNIPAEGDLEVYVDVLKFYSNNNIQEKKYEKRYLMLGLNYRSYSWYIYQEITIIEDNGNIKATYKDSTAEYILHKNSWGALIGKKTNTGGNAIHEFFDLETGEKMFTIKTSLNAVISSCELNIPKIPLVAVEAGKIDKMVGYYDFSTRKYYTNPPKKDERCHGF